jgi:DNA invertase Pin-like site-specific DNA recombinase
MRFFMYCRKSTEDNDRQVLSIQSQTTELQQLAERLGIKIIRIFSESKSAKVPGRPVFAEMMKRLHKKEAEGILCWKLDRLARNPIDGGSVIWAVNQHGIRIVTPGQTFQQGDESLIMMYLEIAIAHKYVVDLSKNVARGMRTKATELGWKPGIAPLGYLNERVGDRFAIIVKDPKRFGLVRRIWDLVLSGHTISNILDLAERKWQLRGRERKKGPGRVLSKSGVYGMLINPFYYGEFEYPRGSGRLYKGKHPPMVTKSEFDRVQEILGRRNRVRPKGHTFAFTGLIRCGECGSMITAEEKFKHQKNGNVHRYVYYHCTKQRRNPRCTQDAIREELLVEQIERFLCRIEVSQDFSDWAIKSVDELVEADQSAETSHVASSSKRLNEIQSSLRELTRMRYRQQIPDDEFERERQILQVEESRINTDLKRGISDTIWRDGAKFIYDALAQISIRFKKADPETQRGLVSAVGSNLQLKDKKLIIEAMEPIGMIHKGYLDFLEALGPFEPPKNGSTATPSPYWHAALRLLCTLANDVRTYYIELDWKWKTRDWETDELGLTLAKIREDRRRYNAERRKNSALRRRKS